MDDTGIRRADEGETRGLVQQVLDGSGRKMATSNTKLLRNKEVARLIIEGDRQYNRGEVCIFKV